MINTILDKNTIYELSKLIGYPFSYFECEEDPFDHNAIPRGVYGNVRLCFDSINIEIESELIAYKEFEEEIARLMFDIVNKNTPFVPMAITDTAKFPVEGIVRGIKILNDTVYLNQGETIVASTSAIEFDTDKGNYTFSQGVWFCEIIDISVNKTFDQILPKERLIDNWNMDTDTDVTVKREIISI